MTGFLDRRVETADGLSLYYRDYPGPEGRCTVLCLHGLTRNSGDFEDLAPRLAKTRRVLAADMRGRGRSGYDPDMHKYHPGTYVADVRALLAAEGIARVVVLGTSMGGIIGMMLGAATPGLLAGLVLNDIGPEIDPAGLRRIAGYVGKGGPVASWKAAADAVRAINAVAMPDLEEADWLRFARRTFREAGDGTIVPAYDARIAQAMAEAGASPVDMWPLFDALAEVPILVLRGETSDILSARTVESMRARHPDLVAVTVPGRGHAPLLDEPKAVAALEAFLAQLT